MEALAVGIRPHLVVTFRQLPREAGAPMPAPARFVLRVFNVSGWPATNLRLMATLADA